MASSILSSVLCMIHSLEDDDPSIYACETIKKNMNQLKRTLLEIQSVLHSAEEKERHEDTVKHWLQEFKHIAYDAEDVLDDYRFQLLARSKVEEASSQTPPEEVCDPTHLPFRDVIACSIKGITERLDELAHRCETLHLMKGGGEGVLDPKANTFPTISHVGEIVVYGREDDRKRVIELLLLNRRSNLSVIPIIGSGGVGKSTLAQLVYNDLLVCEHFDARGWVCVSEDFNLARLMGAILASVSKVLTFSPEFCHLQSSIKQELEGKRFLLVLDDVCDYNQSFWESLRVSLTVGLEGSVVLVTTRDESVARSMQTIPLYHLECLSEEDCWSLFQQCAFGSSREPSDHPNLVAIGKGIIEKLRGLPLAAKMVGCLLSSKTDEESWNNILHCDLLGSGDVGVDVISPVLSVSYYSLPEHLKRCFAYCALFPKDYMFKKDHLVRLWMAEGFILPMEGKQVEDVGVEYFDDLLRRSFFQYSHIDWETFVMHDLIHDLSQFISGMETCKIQDGNLCSITSEARVSSLVPQDFGAEIQIQSPNEPRALRTFVLINRLLSTCAINFLSGKNRLHLRMQDDLFIMLKYLRTLDLSESDIIELPDSIANLKHLRYLGLNHTKIRSLPESICSLYNLQTLEMRDCNKLLDLPNGIKNLTNLRHLDLPRYSAHVPIPPGIGLLTNIQTLSPFYVGFDREHCVIAELKDLMNLRGELEIGGLQNVNSADYAKGVLEDKEHITKLILRSSVRNIFEEKISYDYSIFGGEVEDFLLLQLFSDKSSFDDELQVCKSNWVDHGVQQKATAEDICVFDLVCNEVEQKSTEEEICKSTLLDDGIEQKATEEEICTSNLVQDEVEQKATDEICISNLVSDDAQQKATKQEIVKCNKVAEKLEEGVFECLRPHSNLTELVIQNYDSVRFPSWMGDPSSTKLVSVTLDNCYTCEVLPPLGQLPSLRHLVIEHFPQLESIGHEFCGQDGMVIIKGFPSLETLQFGAMFKWVEWVGTENGEFPRLHQLKLNYCPKLRRMPNHLPFLKNLVMWACDELTVLPILPSLTSLELLGHSSEKIWSSMSQEELLGLQYLKIEGFKDLASLHLHNLFALTELEILNCGETISSCSSLGQQFANLVTLKCLKIHYCPTIWFSDDQQLPSMLQFLEISRCPLLTEWCQRHWSSKLVHFPRVILDGKDFHPIDKGDTHQTYQDLPVEYL